MCYGRWDWQKNLKKNDNLSYKYLEDCLKNVEIVEWCMDVIVLCMEEYVLIVGV